MNWNTREHLHACLKSLPAGVGALEAETIVVDNASSDGSATMVREAFPEVILIANPENRGYAAGNNQGIERAGGAFVCLLNPDTQVPPGALERLVAFLREQPRAGAVAPRLVHPDGRIQESVRGFPTPWALLEEVLGGAGRWIADRFPGKERCARGPYRVPVAGLTEPTPVDQPMASCLLVRRKALEQVGPMDERFPIFFNDVDFCFRLREAGWEIWYLPGVHVLHHGGAATRQVRPAMIRESHRGLHRFYAKHYRKRLPAPIYVAVVAAIHAVGLARWAMAALGARGRRRKGGDMAPGEGKG